MRSWRGALPTCLGVSRTWRWLGGSLVLDPRRSLRLGNERAKRAIGVVGRALIPQPYVRLAGNVLCESRRKAGFTDTRLARDEHDLPFALPGEALASQQEV